MTKIGGGRAEIRNQRVLRPSSALAKTSLCAVDHAYWQAPSQHSSHFPKFRELIKVTCTLLHQLKTHATYVNHGFLATSRGDVMKFQNDKNSNDPSHHFRFHHFYFILFYCYFYFCFFQEPPPVLSFLFFQRAKWNATLWTRPASTVFSFSFCLSNHTLFIPRPLPFLGTNESVVCLEGCINPSLSGTRLPFLSLELLLLWAIKKRLSPVLCCTIIHFLSTAGTSPKDVMDLLLITQVRAQEERFHLRTWW